MSAQVVKPRPPAMMRSMTVMFTTGSAAKSIKELPKRSKPALQKDEME